GTGDRLTRADLEADLADVHERRGRPKEAGPWRDKAAADYRAVLDDPKTARPGSGALAAFWRLQQLYQRASPVAQALRLTQDLAEQETGGLLGPRLHAEQGRLQVFRGEFAASRQLLAGAVAALEAQAPPNLVELPPALLNLAVAELATGARPKAEAAGRRCLDLYREFHLPDDLVLVEAYNLLGTCAAQDGDYARAAGHFREGVGRCDGLGPAADPSRSNLLLNLALLHKAQGDTERAVAVCREARVVYRRFAAPDSLGFAALDAALAALLAAQARLAEANTLADEVVRLCHQHNVRGGPLLIVARHCQALHHLQRRDFPAAEQAWREVDRLHGPKSPLRPRTLNYQAPARECQGQWAAAATLYGEARKLQEQSPRAFPVTHFTTLWRLAALADRAGRKAEARALLEAAVAVVEKARLRTYGDAQQRAGFFAPVAPAFEELGGRGGRDGGGAGAGGGPPRRRTRPPPA